MLTNHLLTNHCLVKMAASTAEVKKETRDCVLVEGEIIRYGSSVDLFEKGYTNTGGIFYGLVHEKDKHRVFLENYLKSFDKILLVVEVSIEIYNKYILSIKEHNVKRLCFNSVLLKEDFEMLDDIEELDLMDVAFTKSLVDKMPVTVKRINIYISYSSYYFMEFYKHYFELETFINLSPNVKTLRFVIQNVYDHVADAVDIEKFISDFTSHFSDITLTIEH